MTETTTPTCFQVAVADTVATTDLSGISECAGKKKRSIEDSPLQENNEGEISPSREEINLIYHENIHNHAVALPFSCQKGRFLSPIWLKPHFISEFLLAE